MRVASLLPAATEILAANRADDLLIARSHACDHPPSCARLPAVTRPALPSPASAGSPEPPATGSPTAPPAEPTADAPAAPPDPNPSVAIDTAVRTQLAAGRPLFELDGDRLAELRPDLIVTQALCEVCAVSPAQVEAAADQIVTAAGGRPAIVSLHPETLEAVLDDHLRLGEAVGRPEPAEAAVHALRSRLWRAQEFVHPYTAGAVVGFIEWADPLYIAGHWTVQLIERAGGRHPLNEAIARPTAGAAAGPMQAERLAGKSIAVPPEAFAATRPEFVVIAPCGLGLEAAWAETHRLLGEPWFSDLPAVQATLAGRGSRVAVVDGSAMFNRPGPRLIDAFEFLVGWLNGRPELIPPGFPWRALAL